MYIVIDNKIYVSHVLQLDFSVNYFSIVSVLSELLDRQSDISDTFLMAITA